MIKRQIILIVCIAFLFAPNLWAAQVAIVSTDTRQGAWTKETANNSDLQTNIDAKVTGPASSTDSVPVLYDGTTGKLIKNSTPTGTGNPVLDTSPTFITGITTPAVTIPQTASAQEIQVYEASGDGTNTHTVTAQAMAASRQSYWPDWVIGFLNSTSVSSTGGVLVNTIGTFAAPTTTNPYTLTAANSYNSKIYYGATGEIDLPALVDGMAVLIYNTGSFTVTIDPNGSEAIVRDGTLQTGGVTMTLSTGAGNYVCLVSDGTEWVTVGFKGTLAVGS